MQCWICGARAGSGEHKVKKSFLVALYGPGPYRDESSMSHVKDGVVSPLQGPDANRLKYDGVLCEECNSARTQPFDLAYDKFCAFVLENKDSVLARRVIDFAEVYGASFWPDQLNLFKYFVKLLGCDLSAHRFAVPRDLVDLLGKQHFQTGLRVSLAINEDELLFPTHSAGIGPMITSQRNLEHRDQPMYRWHTYFSFFEVHYWYLTQPDGPFGAPWIANSQYVYLGSHKPLSADERAHWLGKFPKDAP